MSSVNLTASVRSNLLALQTASELLNASTERLSTGLKVSSALDNPTSYYKAEDLTDQADSLTGRLDGMDESVEVINSADTGLTSISAYLEQMQGLIEDARATTDSDERRALGEEFNELIKQIGSLAKDSDYGGVNLLSGNDSLTVQFAAGSGDSTLTLTGIDIQSGVDDGDDGELGSSSTLVSSVTTDENGVTSSVSTAYAFTIDTGSGVLGLTSAGTTGDSWEIDWGSDDYDDLLGDLEAQLEGIQSAISTQSSSLANSLSVITTRQDFTSSLIDILENGATDLTAADTTEEAANVTSLTTSVSLATQCLSLASQGAQNALTLLTG
jgi:flagellin